jgi:hypothetical protein
MQNTGNNINKNQSSATMGSVQQKPSSRQNSGASASGEPRGRVHGAGSSGQSQRQGHHKQGPGANASQQQNAMNNGGGSNLSRSPMRKTSFGLNMELIPEEDI